ncbi:MAG TPA: hypothetical protein VHL99_06725 [Candidatus Binatia bacterium]|jgi:hypothetical protein|nr:hypothetical protein [Candidatus Binatia bacterium]
METASTALTGNVPNNDTRGTILNLAWLAIVLGIAVELVLIAVHSFFNAMPGVNALFADLVGKMSWSVIVCVGLAFGKAASKNHTAMTGMAGLLSAPIAFTTARTVQKSVSYALGLAVSASAASPFVLGTLKGLEYAALGILLSWIGKQRAGAAAHIGVGFIVGAIFGAALIALLAHYAAAAPSAHTLITQGLNELLFPVGCSLAIFAAEALGKKD